MKFCKGDLVQVRGKLFGMILEYLGVKLIRTGMTRMGEYPIYLVQRFDNGLLEQYPEYLMEQHK